MEADSSQQQYLTSKYVLRSYVASLETTHGRRWQQTPERARTVREMLNGDLPAPIAENFLQGGIDAAAFRVDLPHKYLVTYHARNALTKDEPRVVRLPRGDAIKAKAESTKVEQIMQAVMDDRFPFRDAGDVTLNEGVALAIVLHDTASMLQTPSLYEADGKTVKTRYQVDRNGKTPDEVGKGFRVDKKRAAKLHMADKREIASRRIPLSMEVLGPTQFVPIFGPSLCLDAALVKRSWTLTEVIRRKWVWEGMQEHLSPNGSAVQGFESRGGDVSGAITVTELYAVDYEDDGPHPYVSYLIDGKVVYKRGQDGTLADATLDLRDLYGLTRLPCVLKWGGHWAHPEYDKRAMPFPLPLAQSWRAVDAILTASVVYNWLRGFPIIFEKVDPTKPDVTNLAESPDEEPEQLTPFSRVRVTGDIIELGAKGLSPDFYKTVELLLASNREEGPPSSAAGGPAASGFQASLAKAYAEEAQDDVRDGLLQLYAETASLALETLAGIAEKYGPVPIQKLTPVPMARKGTGTREILDLSSDLVDGYFDLDARWPATPNLARGQQLAEWASLPNPLVLEDEFREEVMNDEHPEIFQVRKIVQLSRQQPEYLKAVLALAAQLAGDQDGQAQIQALQDQQAVQDSQGNAVPASRTAMLPPPGMAGPQQSQQPVPLTGAGGPPQIGPSALGGAIGGPMAAVNNAAAAGGVVPSNIPIGAT